MPSSNKRRQSRDTYERQTEAQKPNIIEPERKPVTWKPWPDEKPTPSSDAPYCPEVGTFYHIVNLKR